LTDLGFAEAPVLDNIIGVTICAVSRARRHDKQDVFRSEPFIAQMALNRLVKEFQTLGESAWTVIVDVEQNSESQCLVCSAVKITEPLVNARIESFLLETPFLKPLFQLKPKLGGKIPQEGVVGMIDSYHSAYSVCE
jgi:hypothetical protein